MNSITYFRRPPYVAFRRRTVEEHRAFLARLNAGHFWEAAEAYLAELPAHIAREV